MIPSSIIWKYFDQFLSFSMSTDSKSVQNDDIISLNEK